jgi:hypothetical protein
MAGADITGVRSSRLPTFMDHFWDRVERTMKKEGLSQEEVLKSFIRGDLTLAKLEGVPRAFA